MKVINTIILTNIVLLQTNEVINILSKTSCDSIQTLKSFQGTLDENVDAKRNNLKNIIRVIQNIASQNLSVMAIKEHINYSFTFLPIINKTKRKPIKMLATEKYNGYFYNAAGNDSYYSGYLQLSQSANQFGNTNIVDYNALINQQAVKNSSGNSKMKTSLCNKWTEKGSCPYGAKCQFAHGVAELRCNIDENSYKTKQCNAFFKKGFCPYGFRCNFSHAPVFNGEFSAEKFKQGNPILIGYNEILKEEKLQRENKSRMPFAMNQPIEQGDEKSITSTQDSKSVSLNKSRFGVQEDRYFDQVFQNNKQSYFLELNFELLNKQLNQQKQKGSKQIKAEKSEIEEQIQAIQEEDCLMESTFLYY